MIFILFYRTKGLFLVQFLQSDLQIFKALFQYAQKVIFFAYISIIPLVWILDLYLKLMTPQTVITNITFLYTFFIRISFRENSQNS